MRVHAGWGASAQARVQVRMRVWGLAGIFAGLLAGIMGGMPGVGMAIAQAAVPQQPRFGLVDGDDGLPSTEISGIAEDREGYLWLATADGLARYDGTGFTVWRHDPRDVGSLPDNAVQALHVDADDRIWVATREGGISVLDAARQRFVHYRGGGYPQPPGEVVRVIAGQGREVWLGTNHGRVYRIDGEGHVRRLELSSVLADADAQVMAMVAASDGTLWIGTTAGLLYHDGRRLRREPMPVAAAIHALAWIDGRLWVSSAAGVMQRDGAGYWQQPAWSQRFGSASGNIVWSMASAGDGEYWLGSERGLWRTQGEAGLLPMLDAQVPLSRRRHVMTLLRGSDGGLWVPLHGRGLAYLRADWKRTAVLAMPAELGDGVRCPLVQAVGGGLWQRDPDGQLSRLDTRSGRRVPLPFALPALRGMPVSAGVEDRRGRLWLGNPLTGLTRVDLRNGRHWSGLGTAEAPARYVAPDTIIEDAQGDIWVRVLNTLQRRDGDTGKVLTTRVFGRDPQLPGDRAGYLGTGPGAQVWVAGERGLRAWDSGSAAFVAVPGLPPRPVQAFALAPDGTLWTYRPGILEEWRQVSGRWLAGQRLDSAAGVPAIEAMDLRVDEQGRVWLATRRGLWRIEPVAPGRPSAVRRFGPRDGLSSAEFIAGCLRLDREGVLAGATVDGNLLLLDTRLPDELASTPRLRIEEISVVRKGQRIALPPAQTLHLRATDRQLRVGARLLSFGDARGIVYRWRMLGLEEGWSERDALAQREFSALPPGTYTLQIEGADALGNASQVHQLHIDMPPPWWRTGAGQLLFGGLGVLAVWAGAALYQRRLRARHAWQLAQHKRELAEQASLAKSHFLATLGHEVRTPMTGVLGMTELLLQTPLDPRQHGYASAIDSAGRHLLRLVNDALDLARIEAGKLALERRDFALHALLRQVVALARPLAERKRLVFRCQIDPAVPPGLRGDPNRVQQILLNLLTNAIKFTDHGEVGLCVRPGRGGHGVIFEVSDSGPGLSAEQQAGLFRRFEQGSAERGRAQRRGSGLGLAICRELATAMGGHIGVDSTPGQGARFRVELPLPRAEHGGANTGSALASPAIALPPLRLLLVEDDDTVAEVVGALLQSRGHHVVRTAHALAALAELQLQSFDVGLFDLDLPGIDGLALVRQVRAMGLALPVLALTARSDPAAEPQARAVGCAGFLRKPVTGDALVQALAALRPHPGTAVPAGAAGAVQR